MAKMVKLRSDLVLVGDYAFRIVNDLGLVLKAEPMLWRCAQAYR